jgi:succinoglycan biosynthesis transport protein ExoP
VGEIAEALRRANAERAEQRGEEPTQEILAPQESDTSASSSPERVYSESQARYRSLQSEEAAATSLLDLTHESRESVAPQGVLLNDGGPVTEACFQLALRVRAALEDRSARSLLVVSALRNEGKTTVACNLALALATLSRGRRVALLDLDLRRPSVANVFELGSVLIGVEAVVGQEAPLERARVSISKPEIDVYPALRPQRHAHELLILPGLAALVAELERRYDAVVVDSPPCLLVPDATLILEHVAAFIPVARAGITRARSFHRMLATLPQRRLLGAIMNAAPSQMRTGDYGYYRQGPEDAMS